MPARSLLALDAPDVTLARAQVRVGAGAMRREIGTEGVAPR